MRVVTKKPHFSQSGAFSLLKIFAAVLKGINKYNNNTIMAEYIMARNKPRVWNDGLKALKTATNPKGGGRVPGRDYSYLNQYPGILAEHRLAYCRMRAQAKYRNEPWNITWEQYQEIWEGKWHLKGRAVDDLCLSREDWSGPWTMDNVSLVFRLEHLRKQSKVRPSKKGIKLGPRKKKNK